MGLSDNFTRQELQQRLTAALEKGEKVALENYLTERSGLPGPRMNTAVANAFADEIGAIVIRPAPPVDQIEALLDGWAALSLQIAPVNQPTEILPASAVLAYGQVAVVRPDWWQDEIAKLHAAATSPRWRTRETVAMALQRMLKADWPRTYQTLEEWVAEAEPLVVRAAVAAVAEPKLLKSAERAAEALQLQAEALHWYSQVSREERGGPAKAGFETLRKALGFTVSVAVAASPTEGAALLASLVKSSDPDLRWIAQENLKKKRLQGLLPQIETLAQPH